MNDEEYPKYEEIVEVYLDKKDNKDLSGRMIANMAMGDLKEKYMDRLVDEYPEWLL